MLAPLCRLLKHVRQFQHPLLLTAWLPSATCRPVSGAGLIAQRTCQRLPARQAKPQWRQRTQGQQTALRSGTSTHFTWDPNLAAPAKTREVGSLLVPFARRTAFELQQAEAARDAA